MSVSGGCKGLPDHPRTPLKVRPRNVNDGRNEKWRTSPPSIGYTRGRRPWERLPVDGRLLTAGRASASHPGASRPATVVTDVTLSPSTCLDYTGCGTSCGLGADLWQSANGAEDRARDGARRARDGRPVGGPARGGRSRDGRPVRDDGGHAGCG